MQETLNEQLDWEADTFLAGIRADKPRYARDQFRQIQSLLDKYGKEKLLQAIAFCETNCLFSANTVRDHLSAAILTEDSSPGTRTDTVRKLLADKPEYHVTVEKRPLHIYAKAGEA